MSNPTIHIAIVDDHPLFRSGIANYLNTLEGFKVTLQAADGQEFLDRIAEEQVDIVLLDLDMPKGLGGQDTLVHLLQHHEGEYPVIIVSHHNDESFVSNLILAGARGYLAKDSEPEEIKEAILGVYNNGFHFTSLVSYDRWIDIMRRRSTREQTRFTESEQLTDRQKEVVRLICEQKSAKEIADELCITTRAVENHKARIMLAIGARNLVGIAIYGIKHGICNCDL